MGRLLLLAFDSFEQHVVRGIKAAGFEDFTPAFGSALRNIDLEGSRITTVARRAHMTKQGMSQLLKELERRGYVEFAPDPTDGRAKIVRLTGKGTELIAAGQARFLALEEEWREYLGDEEYTQLKELLRRLADWEDPDG